MRHIVYAVSCFLLIGLSACASSASENLSVRSSQLEVRLAEDLSRVAAIKDRATGRDYAMQPSKPVGLYSLHFAGDDRKAAVRSVDAVRRSCRATPDGLELRFEHESAAPLEVVCRILSKPNDPMLRWQIELHNRSGKAIEAISYPLTLCQLRLGDVSADDAIVYPAREGQLLCNPAKHMDAKGVGFEYPGALAAQFAYYFDSQGGWYSAAADGAGNVKILSVARQDDALAFTWTHRFPAVPAEHMKVPYDVVWTTAGGSWQDGADVYRHWAEEQPWCRATLAQGKTPEWITRANVFLNINVRSGEEFAPIENALKTLDVYRRYLKTPLVATLFGWERNGAWIGPEYFPPFGGELYYVELCKELARHGDHVQMFTSGFRWGVKKPVTERRDVPRTYTDYDSTERFLAAGKPGAALDAKGQMIFRQVPWADNYTLCAAAPTSREILADCFQQMFAWGAAGVDLDQNIGGEVPDCYSTAHGHAPGAGPWKYQAMSTFLEEVLRKARQGHPERILGVEEPCEAYIPWLDCYHGRAFTDNVWPVAGPGCVAIPLYVYLYHDYQVGYAGWCDPGFSPLGDTRSGLARAFLFGMLPGVRVGRGQLELDPDSPSPEFRLLAEVARLQARLRPYLLLGRMLHDPRVSGATDLPRTGRSFGKKRPERPVDWPAVQATAWRSPSGTVCYALANLSDEPQRVVLDVATHGMAGGSFTLRLLTPSDDRILAEKTSLPKRLPVDLRARQICGIEQTPAK
jgi:hypothetical protein